MAEILTPYDTGQRAEPKLWQHSRAEVLQVMRHGEAEDIGNVDFDDDEGTTVATVHFPDVRAATAAATAIVNSGAGIRVSPPPLTCYMR